MKVIDDIAEGIVNAEKELYEFSEKRRKTRWYCYSIFLLLSQFFVALFILLYQYSNSHTNLIQTVFYAFSSSTIISLVLLFDFSLLYKRYFRNRRTFWKPCLVQAIIILVLALLGCITFVIDLLLQICALPYVGLVCSILGGIHIIASVLYLTSVESKRSRSAFSNSPNTSAVPKQEDPTKTGKKLIRSIGNNSIQICFLDDQWEFESGESLYFGFNKKIGCFVFVNKENHILIDCSKLIYLDYEDVVIDKTSGTCGMVIGALIGGVTMGITGAILCGAEGRLATQAKKFNRLIKFYYLDDSAKEHIVTFVQRFPNEHVYDDGGIRKVKSIADNIPNKDDEIVFRRKLRHKASKMNKEIYPYRPFANDDWFDELQECTRSIRSSRDDGYTVFRRTVINEEHYLNDMTIQTIVQNMSKKAPDKSRVKHEVRILCGQDSVVAAGKNIKSGIKNAFTKRKPS